MANKKYTDFAAGTYDTAKIFLQADATTGDLEKINLPAIPPTPFARLSDFNSTNNSGSNPQTMATLTIPANTLATNGDVIEIYALLDYLTASGTKSYDVRFATQVLLTRSNASAAVHAANINVMRMDSTHLAFRGFEWQGTSVFTTSGITLFTFDPTISNDITVRVTGGAANDIKYWLSYAKFFLA